MTADILATTENNDYQPDYNNNDQELNVEENNKKNKPLTPYDKLLRDINQDERCKKEFSLGKRIGFYRLRGDLGNGNFAKVKLGFHCLCKEKVAVKILDKTKLDEKTQKLLSREISSMEKLHHPNVIRIFEVLETMSHIYIVMEYAPCGELFHKILNEGKVVENQAKTYFSQIVSAITHMHSKNIIHRDIKAENVFLALDGSAKLGDLGFSTLVQTQDDQLNTFCGSPPYAAPELFKDDYYLGRFVDIWALGILLYFMVTGSMPFRADTVGKLKRKILDGVFTVPEHVTEPCKFLICQILRPVPSDRCTLQEVIRSIWLEGTTLPQPSKAYLPKPTLTSKNLSNEEQEAMKQLAQFGIPDEKIEECTIDSRNNINGTFRIAVYQSEKREIELRLEREAKIKEELEQLKLEKQKPKSKEAKKSDTPQSKFCTIL